MWLKIKCNVKLMNTFNIYGVKKKKSRYFWILPHVIHKYRVFIDKIESKCLDILNGNILGIYGDSRNCCREKLLILID